MGKHSNVIPFPTPQQRRTLADIKASVQKAPDLTSRQRQTLVSALNTVGRVLGQPLTNIPAQPAALREQLSQAKYLLAGVNKRRWTDTRSLTLKALQIGGVQLLPGRRCRSTFSPNWVAVRGSVKPHYQMGLSRFMNFCSEHGIEPPQVDGSTFAAFHDALIENSLVPHAENIYRETCRLWDRAGVGNDSWPAYRVGPLPEIRRYALSWDSYPKSFQDDVEAFLTRAADDNIYAPGREYFRPLRPATLNNRRTRLKEMAFALVTSGFPAKELTSLGVLVKPANARKILEFFYVRAGKRKTSSTYDKACLIRTIARNWVKKPSYLSELDDLCRTSAVKSQGMTKRNRERLRQFDNPRKLDAFLNLPAKLMRIARQRDIGDQQAARNAMCAVMIEILTVAPMRIKNVVELRLGKTIIMPRDPKKGKGYISVPAHEVKNDVDLEFALPKRTLALIQEYLKDFRPRLSETQSDFLFPNESGSKRHPAAVSRLISDKLREHAGIEMNVHLFRHVAVKIMQAEYPEAYESWRRLLGHKNLDTTLRYYAEAKTEAAHLRYTDLIESRREGGIMPELPSKWRDL